MKPIVVLLLAAFPLLMACHSAKNQTTLGDKPTLEGDTIRIANEEIEYEIIIIDAGFTSWFNRYARPREFYEQSFLESRNRYWVLEWNLRITSPSRYNPNLYEARINYDNNVDYGYEVNYMLYNYLVYFQLTKGQRLGGPVPRI